MKVQIIKKRLLLIVSIIISSFMCSAAFADLIVGSPGADWRTWTASNLNENQYPYWDGASWDGSGKNVGHYLANEGAFSGSSDGPGTISYWGINGSADLNFFFKAIAPGYTTAIKFEIAGFQDQNIFGWYEVDSGTTHELYNGLAAPGSITSFSPGEDFGYYLKSKEGNTFYTQSSLNKNASGSPIDTTFQHFAVFLDPSDSSFWIGVEDLVSACLAKTDRDYNDFGVKVNPVPEPATMLLLGSGLITLAGIGRRKITGKKKQVIV